MVNDVPTLIAHGDDDQIVPIGASAQLSSTLVTGSTLKVYPGAPHGLAGALVENGVSEGRTLEYKESVGTNDEAKREFLADVLIDYRRLRLTGPAWRCWSRRSRETICWPSWIAPTSTRSGRTTAVSGQADSNSDAANRGC